MEEKKLKKVVFCIPTLTRPYQQTLDALAASIPLINAAGWEDGMVSEIGCPYISAARSKMLHKALKADADVVVFIDHDLSWAPEALLKLIETDGDVVAGTYRFKRPEVEYMGTIRLGEQGRPLARDTDGALEALFAPAGFLKITKQAVNRFMIHYPELCYGDRFAPHIDLFNHGACNWTWFGEDYAFSRRWNEAGENLWLVPDLDITHHTADEAFPGNFHQYLLRQKGGKLEGTPWP